MTKEVIGGDKRGRTADLLNAIQALYQLSYIPKIAYKQSFYTLIRFFLQEKNLKGRFFYFLPFETIYDLNIFSKFNFPALDKKTFPQ